jgi:hypothetical protein
MGAMSEDLNSRYKQHIQNLENMEDEGLDE